MDEALSKLRLRPLHEALRQAISAGNVHLFAEIAGEPARRDIEDTGEEPMVVTIADKAIESTRQDSSGELPGERISEILKPCVNLGTIDPRLQVFIEKCQLCFERALENLPSESREAMENLAAAHGHLAGAAPGTGAEPPPAPVDPRDRYRKSCAEKTVATLRLPSLERIFSTAWPPVVRYTLPSNEPGVPLEQIWAPALAWIVLSSFTMPGARVALFDKLQLRSALAEIFSSMGMEDEKTWRAAARIRVLLWQADAPSALHSVSIDSEEFWADPDVRWLAGVNSASGKTWLNKELFEELLCWRQLPALLETAQQDSNESHSLGELEAAVSRACLAAQDAGYNLETYLSIMSSNHHEGPSPSSPEPGEAPRQA